MPKFNYIAKTKEAKTVKGNTHALSQSEVVSRLRSRGLFVVSVTTQKEGSQKSPISGLSRIRGKRSSVKLFDLTLFARNLATTLSSGVTLLRSLEIIAYQTESLLLEKVLRKICEHIKSGLSFSEAIAKYPRIFSVLWRGIVHVGETSGNLPFVLEKLSDYLELRMEFERKVKSALVYPVILFFAAFVAVIVFLKFILPKFITIFDQFNVKLPLPTRIMFAASRFFSEHFFMVMIGLAGLVFLSFLAKNSPAVRHWWDRNCFKIPLLGRVILTFFLERITSTLYILLDSGLPVVYALEITAQSVGNSFLKSSVLFVQERVKEGASLSEELRKVNIFPLLISEMTKIGEETGTISEVFNKVSVHYRKELTTRVERIIAAFEPLMIIFMGIVIGGIVISLFMPLFKLSSLGG
ncbi:MAG: type II secretion system F family protein [Candidatus Omnitrophica bacterium]|nr:type II secretion system F family protein [Candidatus Omnitrophota bacterium]MBU2044677.1 type II secretion system F family protein [Candidatus Omnitrophota bacterium]MBU2251550.1 type II secretion system F family protein [Candidatus Omnitrophota bacterium]MBU2474239.1 type II secretion system F family protein [Candidatus Omnitrophota bacterium]